MRFADFSRAAVAGALALAASVLPAALAAQSAPSAPASGPCRVLADTTVVPTPEQVAERQQLRLALDSIARQNGVAEPSAILFVDVDTTRQGNVIFIDSNLTPEATHAATRRVEEYLTTL